MKILWSEVFLEVFIGLVMILVVFAKIKCKIPLGVDGSAPLKGINLRKRPWSSLTLLGWL